MRKTFILMVMIAVFTMASGLTLLHAQRTVTTKAGATLRLYSPEDGIPGLQPTNAFATNDGYIWISTTAGTVRLNTMEIEDFGVEYGIHLMPFAYYDRARNHTWFTDYETLVHFDGASFTRYTADDGFILPGGTRKTVNAMHADSQGRLWIGTLTPPLENPHNGGLMVFENNRFRVIGREELPLHNIDGIFEQSDGTLWFTSAGYQYGGHLNFEAHIARYDGTAFTVYDELNGGGCNYVMKFFDQKQGVAPNILEDNDGRIWMSCVGSYQTGHYNETNRGIFRFENNEFRRIDETATISGIQSAISTLNYNPQTDELFAGVFRQEGLGSDEINRSLLVHHNGVWKPLQIIKPELLEELTAEIAGDADYRINRSDMLVMDDGQIYPALFGFTMATNVFFTHLFSLNDEEVQWIDSFTGQIVLNLPGNAFMLGVPDPDILGIYSPPRSRLLTETDGLLQLPAQGGTLYSDHEGNVWITYNNEWDNESGEWKSKGLNMWDGERLHAFTTQDGLTSNVLYKPAELSDGRLWIPTGEGITRMQKTDGRWVTEQVYGKDSEPFRATNIVENTNGDIWTYTETVRPETETFPNLTFHLGYYNGSHVESVDNPFPDSLISLAYQDYQILAGNDRIWLIGRFSDAAGQVFNAPSFVRIYQNGEWSDPADLWGIPQKRLFHVGVVQDKRYFVTEGEFYQFDGERFVEISDSTSPGADFRILKQVETSNMLFDIEGPEHLYIRFRDRGISVFDGQTLSYLDRRNGLGSARLLYPNRDRNGDWMFTTPTGGAIFRGTDFSFFHDDAVTGGLPRAISRDKYGNMLILYLGMGITVTRFDTVSYPVRISSITSDDLRLYEEQRPELAYSQNNISFRFFSVNYSQTGDSRYSHKLDGFNPDWSRPSRQNSAEFRDLPPGEYTFRVRALTPGYASSDETTFTFRILFPWWRQWWAYLIYGLVFVSGVFAIDRIQRRRLRAVMKEQARERELEQAREIRQAYRDLEIAHENLKAAQEQLVQQEKLASLGQLTAGIAHEIKNPLNFVNNFSEVSIEMIAESREEVMQLKQQPGVSSVRVDSTGDIPGSHGAGAGKNGSGNHSLDIILENLDDVESNLRKILDHGSRADRIVKSMLLHSRGGSGKKEPADINAVISEYVNLSFHGMRAGAYPINVDIQLDLDESAGEVPLITEDFSRVVLNLCNNAFDAMRVKLNERNSGNTGMVDAGITGPESAGTESVVTGKRDKVEKGGPASGKNRNEGAAEPGELKAGEPYNPKLMIRTRRENDRIFIEIEDNGPGIPEEFRDKILEPFFTTKKGTEGTGLGLSITHDIIKAHGGSIQIDTKPGKGTVFKLMLPS